MKKYIFILLVFFSFFFYTASYQIFAKSPAEGNPKCKCGHPDSLHANENDLTCSPDANIQTPGFCAPDSYCQDTPAGPQCNNGKICSAIGICNRCVTLGDSCVLGDASIASYTCCGSDAVCGSGGTCVSKNSSAGGLGPAGSPPPSPPPPPCYPVPAQNGTGGCTGVWTAFGVWKTDPASFVTNLFDILLGFSGGIAILILIKSGYKIMMSHGDPEKVAAAKESLTAAIIGILFLIFSFVILEVIGCDLLQIPGFGGTCGVTGTGPTTNAQTQTCQQTYGGNAKCIPPDQQGALCSPNIGGSIDNNPTLCATGTVCCRSYRSPSSTCGGVCIQSANGCPSVTDTHDPFGDQACITNNTGNTCCIPNNVNNNQCGCTVNTACTINGQYCQSTTPNADGSYNIYQCQSNFANTKSGPATWNFLYAQNSPACTPN